LEKCGVQVCARKVADRRHGNAMSAIENAASVRLGVAIAE
jgi:hypothetical protein